MKQKCKHSYLGILTMKTNTREVYNVRINLKSFEQRKNKLQALEQLIKNIENTNGDLYTMRSSTKELLINNLFQLDVLTLKILNIHLEKIQL